MFIKLYRYHICCRIQCLKMETGSCTMPAITRQYFGQCVSICIPLYSCVCLRMHTPFPLFRFCITPLVLMLSLLLPFKGPMKPGLWHSALSRLGLLLRSCLDDTASAQGGQTILGRPAPPFPPVFCNCTKVRHLKPLNIFVNGLTSLK